MLTAAFLGDGSRAAGNEIKRSRDERDAKGCQID
jgi:hypothetical protein